MKRVIYIIAIIWAGIAVVTSCDKNEGAYYPVPSAFSVTPQTVQSVSKDGGKVTLTIDKNNSGTSRKAEITVYPTFKQPSVLITINQQ